MGLPALEKRLRCLNLLKAPMRPLARSLPLKLLRAREAVMERFRPHLAAHNVTEQQWRVLRALAEVGERDASTLAGTACLLAPSLSRILHDLSDAASWSAAAGRRPSHQPHQPFPLRRLLFDTMSKRSEAIYRDLEARLAAAGCSDVLATLDRLSRHFAPETPSDEPKPEARSEKV